MMQWCNYRNREQTMIAKDEWVAGVETKGPRVSKGNTGVFVLPCGVRKCPASSPHPGQILLWYCAAVFRSQGGKLGER